MFRPFHGADAAGQRGDGAQGAVVTTSPSFGFDATIYTVRPCSGLTTTTSDLLAGPSRDRPGTLPGGRSAAAPGEDR